MAAAAASRSARVSPRLRERARLRDRAVSLWSHVEPRRRLFRNPNYNPRRRVIYPLVGRQHIVLFREWRVAGVCPRRASGLGLEEPPLGSECIHTTTPQVHAHALGREHGVLGRGLSLVLADTNLRRFQRGAGGEENNIRFANPSVKGVPKAPIGTPLCVMKATLLAHLLGCFPGQGKAREGPKNGKL